MKAIGSVIRADARCTGAETGDDLGLQRTRPPELADAGHDAVEPPEDRYRTLHARGLPAGGGFEGGEDSMERGRCAAHEHGPRHERLQMPLGGKQPFPVRHRLG